MTEHLPSEKAHRRASPLRFSAVRQIGSGIGQWLETHGLKSRLPLLLIAAVAVALVAIGLVLAAANRGDDQAAESRVPLKLADATVVKGGTPRQRQLLRSAVAGMKQTTLKQIDFLQTSGSGGAVAIAFTTELGPSVRRPWEEWIVAGAFSRRLDAAGLPAEVQVSGRASVFTARPKLEGQPDPQPLSRREEAAVVREVRSAAKQAGGDVVSLEIHRPYGAAVALSVAPKDPARFLKTQLRPLLTSLDVRERLEGLYLAVLDDRGRLALEWGSWTRNPAGTYWVRRDLANCSPIAQSEPPGADPPPACPV
jgi:hypothetical protein